MKIEVFNVKQYNSTYKRVLLVDGRPVIITKGENRMSQCIAYLSDKRINISDGKVKKILDKISKGGEENERCRKEKADTDD